MSTPTPAVPFEIGLFTFGELTADPATGQPIAPQKRLREFVELAKLADEALYVVDGFSFETPSSKQAAEILKTLGITGRVTIVVPDDDINAMLSFRNLAKVRVIAASEANTYDLVDNTAVLITKPALSWLEGVLS